MTHDEWAEQQESRFIKAFLSLPRNRHNPAALSEAIEEFRQALLSIGMFTEENQNAVDNLTYGYGDVDERFSLRTKSSGISISSILNSLEGEEIHPAIRAQFPTITQADWDSAFRVAVMLLILSERMGNSPRVG